MMFQRILVPLDGSALAEQALPTAARLARSAGGSIILLRAVKPPVEYAGGATYMIYTPLDTIERMIKEEKAEARYYLEGIAASPVLEGVHTQLEVYTGLATPMILFVTETQKIDLIVMSSHGRTGLKRWVLGSVAQKVVRSSSVPVMLLRDHGPTIAGPHPYVERPLRVLVSLDGTVVAKAALQPAAQLIAALAAPGQGAMHLLRIVKNEARSGELLDATTKEECLHKAKMYLQSVTSHLREGLAAELNLTVTWSVTLNTDVASAIISVAENGEDAEGPEGAGVFGGCDILALSTHGREGLQRWVMGSITERVLNGTRLPLLIVRPHLSEHGASEAEMQRAEVPS
jgi:nucleotide-binding universal stress UspA family protein